MSGKFTLNPANGANVIGAANSAGILVPQTDWQSAKAGLHKAPLVTGREAQHIRRGLFSAQPNRKVLLALRNVADLYVYAGNTAGLADTAMNDALYGAGTAIRFTTTNNVTHVLANPTVMATPVDMTNQILRLMFRPVSGMNNLLSWGIRLFSSGSPAAVPANYHVIWTDIRYRLTGGTGATPGRWQGFSSHIGNAVAVGSGADLTKVTWAALELKSQGGSMVVDLGNLESVPNLLNKARIIFGFDDAYANQFTNALPILAAAGMPAVLYPSTIANKIDVDPQWLTSDQIKILHDVHGWQIASQAYTSESAALIDGMSEDQRTVDFQRYRLWQRAMGVSGGEHGSYFSGVSQSDMVAVPTFRKFYRNIRCFYSGMGAGLPFKCGETFPFGDNTLVRALNGASWSDATNTSQIKLQIDQTIAQKGVLFIVYHNEINGSGSNVEQGFKDAVAYCAAQQAAGNLQVCTEEDLYYPLMTF
ncbi:hypothetical protein [Herbaspirillum huttiense]|uniref:Polysaccharide deacetylase n=1 Tax=Herbaspirillum huttiense subsp. lycopersici TaxID=3074428 RepID=A0ABU2EFU5_9BURK|nr:hypothetical protein [Herbaspirillum huttiense]MDR9846996.1 hypothetical protein [Herbaspirillum huttiense SE1]